ncbi:PLD nuclease N-terminal domain-containing protein [Agromyces sp. SYSU T00266]|uniref:PLD nuclease N-terminal domain-containing protein n=1 Tax=Agromyces zhanjiangensis TaxID=3158562 RepID=UPI0033981113
MAKAKQWSDLSRGQQARGVIGAVIQLALASAAWTDLARRDARDVNGRKWVWAIVIAVNYLGPISYFLFGRRVD